MSKTATIKATWFEWNYFRPDREKGPYWTEEGSEILTAKDCPRTFIVHYGRGDVRKLLPKYRRHSEEERLRWTVHFGSHERLSRRKIVFELLYAPAPEPVTKSNLIPADKIVKEESGAESPAPSTHIT